MFVTSRDLAGKFNSINGRVTDNFLSDFTREHFNGFFRDIRARPRDDRLHDFVVLVVLWRTKY